MNNTYELLLLLLILLLLLLLLSLLSLQNNFVLDNNNLWRGNRNKYIIGFVALVTNNHNVNHHNEI